MAPKLFPGILAAILAVIPGWILGAFLASPQLLTRPLVDNLAMMGRGTPIFLLIFGVITLTYGTVVWLVLRAVGALSFLTLLVAAALPVVVYAIAALWRYGIDSGWYGALLAFGAPALCIGAALWLLTVRMPL